MFDCPHAVATLIRQYRQHPVSRRVAAAASLAAKRCLSLRQGQQIDFESAFFQPSFKGIQYTRWTAGPRSVLRSSATSRLIDGDRCEALEPAHRFLITVWPHRHVVRSIAHIDSCVSGPHERQSLEYGSVQVRVGHVADPLVLVVMDQYTRRIIGFGVHVA